MGSTVHGRTGADGEDVRDAQCRRGSGARWAVNGWAYWTHTGADDVPISLWDLREQLTGLARLEGLGTEQS
jgi:hypothetical protein